MRIFNDRRADHLYGSNDIEGMFPEGTPKVGVPWEQASRRKNQKPYDNAKVQAEIRKPATHNDLHDMDPRNLRASQPSLIRPALAHYMGPQFEEKHKRFEPGENPGNQWPVVYSRHEEGSEDQHIILSGHHRAAAALLKGKALRARRVSGGWGDPR